MKKTHYFGGHTHTQTINIKKINVDSGFIVFNQINYPNLCNLFEELKIKSYDSDMSFCCFKSKLMNLEYSGTDLIITIFSKEKFI